MPTSFEFLVEQAPAPTKVVDRHLHGLACAVFEGDQAPVAHDDQAKPFVVQPLHVRHDKRVVWPVRWLRDDLEIPHLASMVAGRPIDGRLGSTAVTLRCAGVDHVPFVELSETPNAVAARLSFLSPTWFSSRGKDLPLPDPWVMVHALARRWNSAAPEELHIADDAVKALAGSLMVTAVDIETVRTTDVAGVSLDELGRPEEVLLREPEDRHRHPRDRTGFVGVVELAIDRDGAGVPERRRDFARLLRFGEIAGIGARTTHGCGATAVELRGP